MAVLTNTMMQGTAADTGSGDDAVYNIEKSLRFNEADDAMLSRSIGTEGNRRTWTFATWIKRPKLGVKQVVFNANSSGSWDGGLEFNNSDQLQFYAGEDTATQFVTNRKFRDPGAWFHITVVYDSTNYLADDRLRLYINGARETSFSAYSAGTQNLEGSWSRVVTHYISAWNAGYHADSQLAETLYIDGLVLSPAAFGSFDSTGVWNPKKTTDDDGKFILPAPNDGTTWSSGVAADSGSDTLTNAANGFNGDLSSSIGGIHGGWTWTVPSGGKIENVYSLRFFTASYNSTGQIKFNGNIIEGAYNFGGADAWYNVPVNQLQAANYEVTSLSWNRQPGQVNNTNDYLCAVEVNGVILIDGHQTDTTTLNNPNNGTTWSTYGTLTNYSNAGNAFDGKVTPWTTTHTAPTMATGSANSTWTWDLGSSNKITGVETITLHIWPSSNQSGSNLVKINDTDVSSQCLAFGEKWVAVEIDDFTEFQKLEIANNYWYLAGIAINGHLLIDSSVDNSFHLKFNDTSANKNLGYSQVLNTPTGAQPMYGPGADDSAKASLVYAIPGYDTVDHHPTIKGSGSAKTNTVSGAAVNTTKSKFYGSSLYFDGSNDVITTPDHADFDMTSSDATIELWFNPHATSGSYRGIFSTSAGTGDGHTALTYGPSELRLQKSGVVGLPITMSWTTGRWYHIAITRVNSSSTTKVYIDGVEKASSTSAFWSDSSRVFEVGKYGSEYGGFYLNDFRVYKGTCKYTSAFTPPTRNDWTVTNLTHSTTGGDDGPWATGFRSGGSDWNGGTAKTDLESGDSYNTSGNNAMLQIDTSLLGNYDLTFTKTSGDDIHFYTSASSGSGYGTANPSHNVSTFAKLTNVGTPTHTYSRYVRMGGASSGNAVFTITGAIDMPDGVSKDIADLDISVDSPTNYLPTGGNDALGGVTRGDYCTLNPLSVTSGWAFSEGNLKVVSSGSYGTVKGTIGMTSGKWYAEMTAQSSNTAGAVGVVRYDHTNTYVGGSASDIGYGYLSDGRKATTSDTRSSYGASWAIGDTIGIALDLSGSTGTVTFYKNGATQGQAFTLTTADGPWFFAACDDSNASHTTQLWNFGQRAFEDEAPTNHKCLCTQNLDDTFSGAQKNNPSKYFDVTTYTGNASAGTAIKGFGFQPDLVWIKERNNTANHGLFDSVRGVTKFLRSNGNVAETTDANSLTAFDSDGFTLGTGGSDVYVNRNNNTYVAWAWDAGTAAATPSSSYDITPSAQWINATAGFSITKYTSDAGAGSVPHGLGTAPDFRIHKSIGATSNWEVRYKFIDGSHDYMVLNGTTANGNSGMTLPNNNVFYDPWSSGDSLCYAWTAIPGYSAFGKYDGSSSETFIYTGFQPRWIMVKLKSEDLSTGGWKIIDTARDPFNDGAVKSKVAANENEAENGNTTIANNEGDVDILSNGFRITDNHAPWNTNGRSYIYAAFAAHPFKTARAQ